MVMMGETVETGAEIPKGSVLSVMRSAAGYFLGYEDEDGSPYTRESGYFQSSESATVALRLWERGLKVKAR